jgi:hypothetical protein
MPLISIYINTIETSYGSLVSTLPKDSMIAILIVTLYRIILVWILIIQIDKPFVNRHS